MNLKRNLREDKKGLKSNFFLENIERFVIIELIHRTANNRSVVIQIRPKNLERDSEKIMRGNKKNRPAPHGIG